MAKGRFLSCSIAEDKRLNELSIEAQLVYLMAIPHLDRDGLIAGDVPVLFGRICPRRMELAGLMPDIIRQWLDSGLVIRYESDNGDVLWFVGFAKNQQGLRYDREKPSIYDPPPGYESDGKAGLAPVQNDTSGLNPEKPLQEQVQEQVQVQDQVQVKDQGQAPLAPPDDDGAIASEPKHKKDDDPRIAALYEKLHSVGVMITEHVVDSYMAFVEDEAIDFEYVLRGITAAAENQKQHRFKYVAACIRNLAGGTDAKTAYQDKEHIEQEEQRRRAEKKTLAYIHGPGEWEYKKPEFVPPPPLPPGGF